MNIAKNSVVALSYTLKVRTNASPKERHVEETTPERPFVFIYGAGMLLPDFEKNLTSKKARDKFNFFIAAENGYGIQNDKYVMNIPIDSFKNAEGTLDLNEIKVGHILTMNDDKGNQMQGTILEVTAEHVRMDFNHPLAGHELHFTGEVLDVRAATEEEISHGHVHGPGGHQH
jgi:FKBP-type peptidyl-prolyl cis-trans isomerase SlyD